MRRMLDPKEIEGGGGTLYRHFLSIVGKYSVKASATLNYYSYKKEEYTIKTFRQTFLNDVSVTGYFFKDNKSYIDMKKCLWN